MAVGGIAKPVPAPVMDVVSYAWSPLKWWTCAAAGAADVLNAAVVGTIRTVSAIAASGSSKTCRKNSSPM
jgi:hypothetical protein